MLKDYLQYSGNRAMVYYAAPDRTFAEETATVLDAAARDLTAYFEPGRPLPRVRAILAPDRDAFDELVADVLKIQIERPSDRRRIAQPQRTDMVFLSPSAYALESAYTYIREDYLRMAHHELVHVFEEHLSPDVEASPLWWGEGLAVYLSGQWRHKSQFGFREPVLEAIQGGRAPSLPEIQKDLSLAYAFGWTLVRFIEQARGKAAIVHAVKHVDDGNVLAALNEDIDAFGRSWRNWLTNGAGGGL